MNEVEKQVYGTVVSTETPTSKAVGSTLLKGSAVGGGLYLAAAVIPFINFPFLLMLMVVTGLWFVFK